MAPQPQAEDQPPSPTALKRLAIAETVVVSHINHYGPKLRLAWLDHEGHELASIS